MSVHFVHNFSEVTSDEEYHLKNFNTITDQQCYFFILSAILYCIKVNSDSLGKND